MKPCPQSIAWQISWKKWTNQVNQVRPGFFQHPSAPSQALETILRIVYSHVPQDSLVFTSCFCRVFLVAKKLFISGGEELLKKLPKVFGMLRTPRAPHRQGAMLLSQGLPRAKLQ